MFYYECFIFNHTTHLHGKTWKFNTLWNYQMVLVVKYSLMLIITMECIILNHAPKFSWLNKEGESFKIKIKMN